MRTPFQDARPVDRAGLRTRVADGVRFLWSQPFLRTCALIWGLGNFALPGVLLTVVVLAQRDGLSSGRIGLLTATFGACILLGSLASPLFRRRFSVRTILLLELWAWLGCGAFLIWPSVYVLVAGILPTASVSRYPTRSSPGTASPSPPTVWSDAWRASARRSRSPSRRSGRSPPALLLSATSERATVAVFAACGLVLAVWGTLSPAIRDAPSLADIR